MTPSKTLNILCFGDSLTAGCSVTYGDSLKKSLEAKFPQLKVTVDVQGLGGDRVVCPPGHFLPRMTRLYESSSSTKPYDYAVILGGTNDLCREELACNVWPELLKVWSIPLAHHTKVLAMTVPEFGLPVPKCNSQREILNTSILNHSSEHFYSFDLCRAIPYWDTPAEERERLWADPIHFTAHGYELIGSLLADRLGNDIMASL